MVIMINYSEIEKKWQKRWEDAGLFEIDPNDKEGCLITAAFPYLNMPLHIGHLRTYCLADMYARYLRFAGKNAIYPMGRHKTGTPTLAIAKRINANDPEIFETLKLYGVPEEEARMLTTPELVVDHFDSMVKDDFKRAGLGIDWRRTFTSIDDKYSKMIEWQFLKLKEKGYLVTGKYVIGWCTNEMNAVGQHDTKGDTSPEIEEMVVVEFEDESTGIYYPCATYRPETISGVSNLFIKAEAEYVIAGFDNKKAYISRAAFEILKLQREISEEGSIVGAELIKHKAINPLNGSAVLVLNGSFVKPDFGTGVVMSVPAHAPFDYVELERLNREGSIGNEIRYKRVLEIKADQKNTGEGSTMPNQSEMDLPALMYLKRFGSGVEASEEQIEEATRQEYLEEEKFGVMRDGMHDGMRVPEARAAITNELEKKDSITRINVVRNYGSVYCRCGTKVVPKLVDDQWFINYGDPAWKEMVKRHFKEMSIIPKSAENAIDYVIDWLNLKPAERAQGLGTRFPFNKNYIIESLSDSTIYTTLYTYIHILNARGIKAEQLKPTFFDYMYVGGIEAEEVSEETGIDVPTLRKCKEELEYWYAFTSRHSGSDLIYNHLTMYMFNHVGLLSRTLWPKQIVANGLLSYEGKKMSKSEGNIVPIKEGIKNIGADILRFIVGTSSDIGAECGFTLAASNSVKLKNESLVGFVEELKHMEGSGLTGIDYWLYLKLNTKIREATKDMGRLSFRDAYVRIYYDSINELKYYRKRGGNNQAVVHEFLEKLAIMLSPPMPHFAEEIWSMLGHEDFIERERWPTPDESMMDESYSEIEDTIIALASDIQGLVSLTGKARNGAVPKCAKVIVAAQWKLDAYNNLASTRNIREAIEKEYEGASREEVSKFISQFGKKLQQLRPITRRDQKGMAEALKGAENYLSETAGFEVNVAYETESNSERAHLALPDRPAIEIVW